MDNWRKSTRSHANGGACVEVAAAELIIAVRDTTDRDGASLSFGAGAWRQFTTSLKQP